MIPGCSPYKGSEISRGKEIFSSARFEEANNHDVRESTGIGPEKGWPLDIGRKSSPRTNEKMSPLSYSCKELNPATNQ